MPGAREPLSDTLVGIVLVVRRSSDRVPEVVETGPPLSILEVTLFLKETCLSSSASSEVVNL